MKDHLETKGRLLSEVLASYKTTFEAFCELVNNSIQAKATKIEVFLVETEKDDLSPYVFKEIRLLDNGVGVSQSEFHPKIMEIATDAKIGGKGVGRFAAFQLGPKVLINSIAYDESIKKYTFSGVDLDGRQIFGSKLNDYEVDIEYRTFEETKKETYYLVQIHEFWNEIETENSPKKKIVRKFLSERIKESLFIRYSTELLNSEIEMYVNNSKIDPKEFIIGKAELKTFEINTPKNGVEKVNLEFIHYRGSEKRVTVSYRSDNSGVKTPGYDDELKVEIPEENSWLVHVDSKLLDSTTDIYRNLYFDGLDEDINILRQGVVVEVDKYLKDKFKKYYSFRDKLVADAYYPYTGHKSSSDSKTFAFNQLAYQIEKEYSILQKQQGIRRIVYPLLDKAINNGDVEGVLESIISLSDVQIASLKRLLEKVEISEVIKFSEEVVEKQQFIEFLEKIVYTEIGKYLKERSQLHKIVQRKLWIFGEEYTNTPELFSDKNLENNLKALHDKYFVYEPCSDDDNLQECESEKIRDITDLFFFNERMIEGGRREIMIIELKAPKVRLGQKEISQVEKYMFDIEKIDKFSKNLKYKIILVSTGLSDYAESKIGVIDPRYPTMLSKSKTHNIEVHMMRWSDIINQNKQNLSYLGNYLKTKDVDITNIFEKDYPELDISNIEAV